jgi:hypothetical protein
MRHLLDRFKPIPTDFQPTSPNEIFALRLAQKLGDTAAVRHYVTVVDGYSEAQILCAFRRTLRNNGNGGHGKRFVEELQRVGNTDSHNGHTPLISIRIERRSVAAVIVHGVHLEYADARQLSSDRDKALASAVGFIRWMLGRFPVEAAALESIFNGHEIQRRVLHNGICQMLRDEALPIWEIPRDVLLQSFGYPPLKSRAQLREVATKIWPVLTGTHAKLFIQDAALLGLHIQTERLFIIN